MLIVLCGQTASGKTTTRDMLIDRLDFRSIVTYTTRPMRKNERNGIDYNFVSEEEFGSLRNAGKFFDVTQYTIGSHTYYYGSMIADSLSDNDYIIILNPDGVKTLSKCKQYSHLDIIVILIDVEYSQLLTRAVDRGDILSDTLIRLQQEQEEFDKLKSAHINGAKDNIIDYVVNVTNDDSIEDVTSKVWNIIQQIKENDSEG